MRSLSTAPTLKSLLVWASVQSFAFSRRGKKKPNLLINGSSFKTWEAYRLVFSVFCSDWSFSQTLFNFCYCPKCSLAVVGFHWHAWFEWVLLVVMVSIVVGGSIVLDTVHPVKAAPALKSWQSKQTSYRVRENMYYDYQFTDGKLRPREIKWPAMEGVCGRAENRT